MLPGMSEDLCVRIVAQIQTEIRKKAVYCVLLGRGAVVVDPSAVPTEDEGVQITIGFVTLEAFERDIAGHPEPDRGPRQMAELIRSAESSEVPVIVSGRDFPQYAITIAREP